MCIIYDRRSQEGMMFYEQYKSAAFLGMFKKLQKATISFVISSCPSLSLSVCLHETFHITLDGFS
jgi:NAD-specific glutamate dehydrogenase